jgi:uroporphyrinogen decarboxylase
LFVGTSGATTVLGPGYEKLKAHLGIHGGPPRWYSKTFQYAWMDEEVLLRLGSDARAVLPGPVESCVAKEISDDYSIDAWGVHWRKAPGSIYFEVAETPLRTATIDDLEKYPWPKLISPSRFVGLAERAKAIQKAGFATVLLPGVTILEQACLLRGLDVILMDLAANEDFFTALMEKLTTMAVSVVRAILQEAGPWIDIVVTSDDLGMSSGPMMSPATYRRLIKPHHAEFFGEIKKSAAAKVFFHSCGNVYRLLGDLADAGVDILNPVQVNCGEMGDTARLKQEFGDKLSFCGGIDTHHVMPHGTIEDVRREVRRRIKDLGPGGGYLAAPVHCLQPDVPPENIVAMCEEIKASGRYA